MRWKSCLISIVALVAVLVQVGCEPKPQAGANRELQAARYALHAEQIKVYPHLAGCEFRVLEDFEPLDDTGRGRLSIQPAGEPSQVESAPAQPRTGKAARQITLAPTASVVYTFPRPEDFSKYTLLSLALEIPDQRDDLQVTLISKAGAWTSPRNIVRPGWNDVLIDIQRLAKIDKFDCGKIMGLKLSFANATSPVTFALDDILLVTNDGLVTPVPAGLKLARIGLNYGLKLPGSNGTVKLTQRNDGLWRLGAHQPAVKFVAPAKPLPGGGESLDLLGTHRVGQVKILEHNAVRVRLANTWFFPNRPGEWAIQGLRDVRWVYTFYGDGRWITDMQINNAGGPAIGTVSISFFGRPVAWAGAGQGEEMVDNEFVGPVAAWSYMLPPVGSESRVIQENYLCPAKIQAQIAKAGQIVPGDRDKDGFDESQGCYYLAASKGHCRFRVIPSKNGVIRPVFRIFGPWREAPSVNMEGLAVRKVVLLPDGSAIFTLPGKLTSPTSVETFGTILTKRPKKKY